MRNYWVELAEAREINEVALDICKLYGLDFNQFMRSSHTTRMEIFRRFKKAKSGE